MRVPIHFRSLLFTNLRINKSKNVIATHFTAPSYKPAELNVVSLKSNEKNYLRGVLSNCRECILYEPVKTFNVRELIVSKDTTAESATSPKNSSRKELFESDFIRKLINLARPGVSPDPNVVSQLETRCFKEYKWWSVEKQLLVLDLWHHVPESIQIKFIWSARNELLHQFSNLSHDHALQTLYYLTWLRGRMPGTQQKILQNRFMKEISSMTLEAMSVWCVAMYRNHAFITNRKLIEEIYAKLLENDLKKFHDVGLGSVLKVCFTLLACCLSGN